MLGKYKLITTGNQMIMVRDEFSILLRSLETQIEQTFWCEFMECHCDTDEVIPIGIMWMNRHLKTMYMNPIALDCLGLTLSQVLGQNLLNYCPEQIAKQLNTNIKRVIKTKDKLKSKQTVTNPKTGKNLNLEVMMNPIINFDTDAVMGVYVVAQDTQQDTHVQIIESESNLEFANDINRIVSKFRIQMLHHAVGNGANDFMSDISHKLTNLIRLTEREKSVLYFLSYSKSPAEIAEILSRLENNNITIHVVNSVINRGLYVKFNVANTCELIEKAQLYGLIPLSALLNEPN